MLALLGKLFGQDLTKMSLPVILAEPTTLLQKAAEVNVAGDHYLVKAAASKETTLRMVYCLGQLLTQHNFVKHRCKKPFNPMLGETYELVTEHYRFFAEQVSHHPPVSAFLQEGRGYKVVGQGNSKQQFGFGGGKGLLYVTHVGAIDYIFEDGQTISVSSRPAVHVKNVVFGQVYMDFAGTATCINHQTGDRAEITFVQAGWTSEP